MGGGPPAAQKCPVSGPRGNTQPTGQGALNSHRYPCPCPVPLLKPPGWYLSTAVTAVQWDLGQPLRLATCGLMGQEEDSLLSFKGVRQSSLAKKC